MELRQGIDITSVKRMEKAIVRQGARLVNRIFTSGERAYCEGKRMKYEHYAARFAAKEAVMKAVGVKRKDRFRFGEIEVRRQPTGKPYIYLSGITRKRFGLPEKFQMELSITHEREYAMATVLIVIP